MAGPQYPSVPVLMLHGVCDPVPDYASMPGRTCLLGVEEFDQLLDWCRKDFDVLRLGELNELIACGRAGKYRPIVLTFDDGLASTLDHAVPLLRREGLSATMFVATDWIDSAATPLIFELERVLFFGTPTRIEVSLGDHSFRREVESTDQIAGVLSSLWTFLFERRFPPLKLPANQVMVGDRPLGSRIEPDCEFWFPASWDELRAAATDGVLEIGSHMQSHTPLTWLDADHIEEEMAGSKKRLEAEFGSEVLACSYPHGMSSSLVRASAEKVYEWGFTNIGSLLRAGTSRHRAPRFHVPGERWDAVKNRIRVARLDPFDIRHRLRDLVRLGAHRWRSSRTLKPS